MSLGSAYGYSMGGNPYNFGSMQLPAAGTPLQSTANTLGYGGAIPGQTGYNTGATAAYQQQLASMAAQQAGLTGFYSAPRQSAYSPGTFLRIDPSTYDPSQGTQLDYVTPSGQLQRVSTQQAQQMGWNGDLGSMINIPYSTAATLEGGAPQGAPTQTLQGLQGYQQLNTNAQTAALQAAQATGMYTQPSQIYAPGTNAGGGKFQDLDQATQQAYYYSNGGDWNAAMNKWVSDSNAAIAQANGGQLPNQPGTPTETQAAQQQYFNQAQQLAAMYGQYYTPNTPTGTSQAGVNGPQAGQQTLAAQQQGFTENLQTQQFQQSAAQSYLQLLSQLQGPADYGQYLKVLGATPGGLQSLVGAAAGQFVPGTGSTGVAPQAQTLSNLVNAGTGQYNNSQQGLSQMAGYQPWMAGMGNQQYGTQSAYTGGGNGQDLLNQQAPAQGQNWTAPSNMQVRQQGQQNLAQQNYQSLMGAASGGTAGAGYGAGSTGTGGGSASQGGMNYSDFMAQAQGLPSPNQIAPQAFGNMLPSQQAMMGSMYSNLGYDVNDVNAMYKQSLPKYAAGSSSGSFRLV